MAGVATALPLLGEARLALAQVPAAAAAYAAPKTWINANEHPEGPCAAARAALGDMIPLGGRYLFEQTGRMVEACARHLGLRTDHVLPYAGSSEPLHYGVLAFTSAKRGLVTANPTFEAAWEAAAFTRARVAKVALAADGAHDLRRMVAADRRAGLVYVCNPNNPTGTITPRAEIEWALAHMPRGAVMMVDEAYIEYGDERSVVDLVAAGADLVVLRTFSKIYGMAGVRCGLALARPELLKRLEYFGANPMPIAATAAAIASLGDDGAGGRSPARDRRSARRDLRLAARAGLPLHALDHQLLPARRRPARQAGDGGDGRARRGDRPHLGDPAEPGPHHDRLARRDAALPRRVAGRDARGRQGRGVHEIAAHSIPCSDSRA